MKLQLTSNALKDLEYWIKNDRQKTLKIINLFEEIIKKPFIGKGKPEPLKYDYNGCWSRRIDHEHRVVYLVEKTEIIILSCRYHY